MTKDEIAIVGAGCRFPGAENTEEFWRVLVNGENHVKDIPDSRWNTSAFYDEDKTAPGKIYVRKAGLLDNHDKWDNKLFGISDVEASRMDPQQRYVLECVHMALEDGGFTRQQISGSKTGVIIGCMNDDYKSLANSDLTEIGSYNATGTATSVISARVSYVYNLHGTCLTLDTACSSSLTAVHLAAQAINTGDCDMVICGGVNSILTPDTFKAPCEARMMSAIGQCQSFCDTADGYARGEGCGIVILKSLKAAVEDRNKIWATVRIGSNQDGCISKPMTAPSGHQQLKLLKRVYKTFQFEPADIQYIEAHGTGTPRGDPTELNALGEFFSSFRKETSEPLLFGSVKSNIGHSESAAGVAGLLKVILMMKNGLYVPSLHVRSDKSNLNQKKKLAQYNLEISSDVKDWPSNIQLERHACINSFGFGGSNTHVIVTQKKDSTYVHRTCNNNNNNNIPICLSGVNLEAVKSNILQFCEDIHNSTFNIEDIAFTSFNHRDIYSHRTLVFGEDKNDIQAECSKRLRHLDRIFPVQRRKIIFVYCGVGTTWTGMCQEMMSLNGVFKETIRAIDKFLYPLTDWKIGEKFVSNTSYDDPFLSHIAIFCSQVALTEVWRSFGVVPDAVIGQSVGEIAAAYAANLLTLEEAVKIVYHRSEILSRQSKGSMAVIGSIGIAEVEKVCSEFSGSVCIAVYSSPVACTLSGSTSELKLVTDRFQVVNKNGVYIKLLKVNCAYHSRLLDNCLEEIKAKIETCFGCNRTDGQRKQTIPMMSTVTGGYVVPADIRNGSYWASNVRDPVLFMQAIKQIYDSLSFNVYLEIGPRPVLKVHLPNIIEIDNKARAIHSLLPNAEVSTLYGSLAELFELGLDINHVSFLPPIANLITEIPRYRFHRTGALFIPTTTKDYLAGVLKERNDSHMFVKTSKRSNNIEFVINIEEKSTPFVYDHFLFDDVIIPGAMYIDAGFHVGRELLKKPVDQLTVSSIFTKMFKPVKNRKHQLAIQIKYRSDNDVEYHVRGDSNLLAVGKISERKSNMAGTIEIEYLKAKCTLYKSKRDCYNCLKSFNFRYGDSLNLMQRAWVSETRTKCLAEISLSENVCDELLKTHFHPAVIDAMFQVFGILAKDAVGAEYAIVVPKGVNAVVLNKSVEKEMYIYAEEVQVTKDASFYNAVLLSDTGNVIAEMENFYTQKIASNVKQTDISNEYILTWSELDDNSDKKITKQSRVVLFSNTRESVVLQKLQAETNVSYFTDIQKFLNKNNVFSEDIPLVYHVAGIADIREGTAGEIMLDSVVKRFFEIKKLLTCVNLRKEPPFIVITENTQLCPGRSSTINYIGSELWGMLRSAIHEDFNKNIKLVDIDKNSTDVAVLLKLFTSAIESGTEFAISGSKLFRASIQIEKKAEKIRRPIVATKNDKMALYSNLSQKNSEPYLMLLSDSKNVTNAESVILGSFSQHCYPLYLSIDKESIEDLELKQNEEAGRIVIVEGKGKLKEAGNDTYFLYPTTASTIIEVPKEYLFDTRDCPEYTSGMLILANLLFHLSSAIKDSSSVIVIKHSAKIEIGQKILMTLLAKKQCKTHFVAINEINASEPFLAESIIITTFLAKTHWKSIMNSFTHQDRKIVLLNIHLKEDLQEWLMHNFPDINLKILSSSEILNAKGIKDAIPSIKVCMRYLKSNNLEFKSNDMLLKLPLPELQMQKKIEDGTMKCYCNAGNIFRANACYIIVGGLTGLGWELLRVMIEMGAGIVITMSRRSLSDQKQQYIKELENQYSCRIVHLQADISELESVYRALSDIQNRFPNSPIRGIFHGAGIILDSLLENLDEQKVIEVMRPKILGAWNLHVATLDLQLDYFLLHSSIVSVIGNPAQCNYAAANSFLDSFALYRRTKGLPAQHINWGALSIGMAVENDTVISRLARNGFNYLETEMIRAFFVKVLMNDFSNVIYADIEWNKLLLVPTFSKQYIKYTEVTSSRKIFPNQEKLKHFDFSSYNEKTFAEKESMITIALKEIIQELLAEDDNSVIDQRTFVELGIDSMAAMSLANAIDETFKCRISVNTLLSEKTTLSTITEFILVNIGTIHNNENEGQTLVTHSNQNVRNLFESKMITFMQKDLLTKYLKNRNDPYYLRVLDFEMLGIKLHMDDWKMILTHVIKRRPELRRKYIFSDEGDVSVESFSKEDIEVDVTMVSIETLGGNHVSDARMMYNADISDSLPIFFYVAEFRNNTIVRIVTHALVIDMKGISMICKDMEKKLVAFLSRNKVNDLPLSHPEIDIAEAVRKSLSPRMKTLHEFWKKYTDYDIKPVTLGKYPERVDVKFCCVTRINVPKMTVDEIKCYVIKQGISLYEFIMTLYQLYLYFGSNCLIIPVGTATDIRFHVPELNNVVTRCANYIPVIAHIDRSFTLTDFMKENCSRISSTTKNGAYPSSLILNEFKSPEAKEHVFRHFLVMNDMTEISSITKGQIRAEVKRIWHVRPDRETFIYVSYDLKNTWIRFEIGHNTKICGELGKTLPDKLLWLAYQVINFGGQKVEDLQEKMNSNIVKAKQENTPKEENKTSETKVSIPGRDTILATEYRKTTDAPIRKHYPAYITYRKDLLQAHYNYKCSQQIGRCPSVATEPVQQNTQPDFAEDMIISGLFDKQTSHGWDHKVEVTLNVSQHVLTWNTKGKHRRNVVRTLPLTRLERVVKRTINGSPSLVFYSSCKTLVLKAVDAHETEEFFEFVSGFLSKMEQSRQQNG